MAKTQRSAFVVFAVLFIVIVWLANGSCVFSEPAENKNPPAGEKQAKEQLKQAAASLVEAAKERIAAAKTDEEAIQRSQLSFEALRMIGTLGGFDTNAQAGELMDGLEKGSRPAVAEAIVQMRLMNALRQWAQLNESQRTAAIDSFVGHVKKTGLKQNDALMLMRAANMMDDGEESKLIVKALKEVLPLAQESDNAQVKRMASAFEGIVRRLELPGNPLELEGTLLDGKKLDWKSYRGKVVLVDFHASWCGPCRAEVPNILENYNAYHDKGFEVIGINLDKDRAGAQKYINETGFHFPVIFGDEPSAVGWDAPMSRKYGITGIPQVILVDREGKVVSTNARGEQLGELLQKQLGAPEKSSTRNTSSADDPSIIPSTELKKGANGVIPASAEEEASAAPEPPK